MNPKLSREDLQRNNPVNLYPEHIDPIRLGLGLIYRRIKWVLKTHARSSRAKLIKYRNYSQRLVTDKAVIVCNGPSLNNVDLSKLENVYTFGLNKINLLFDRSAFRPNCIVSVNPFVIEQNQGFYNETEIPLFLDSVGIRNVKPRKNVTFLYSSWPFGFAKNCSNTIFQGYTVTYVAMQLAYHFGFKKVGIVGADHNFAEKGKANLLITGGDKDVNHFDSNYFAGQDWQLPDMYGMEMAYARAREVYEASGRKIVNCTEKGKLEVFEREDLEIFLNT